MQLTQVTPNIGTEVSGIDLSKPLGDQIIAELRGLFVEHMVLVLRVHAESGLQVENAEEGIKNIIWPY